MPRFMKNVSQKAGTAPGTLVHIGEKKTDQAKITLIEYDSESASEREITSLEELQSPPPENKIRWVNVDGLHDTALVEAIGKIFRIHPLTLEDIVNAGQRPKTEEFDDYLYAVVKRLHYQEPDRVTKSEQLSLILRDRLLISFQEEGSDFFERVKERIRKGKGRIRSSGSDFLAYTLMDTVVDQYYRILETLGEELESLEEALLSAPSASLLQRIHALKRETVYLRKHIWPLRETVSTLFRDETVFISEATRIFLRDVYDHTIQMIELIESYRDILAGLLDLYMSGISYRMNEVMKVLTIISTIFIPITFVAGVYGMNFKVMPELDWPFGYAWAWGIMIAIVMVMLIFFRRKKWL